MSTTYIIVGLSVAIAIWITSYLLGYYNGKNTEIQKSVKQKQLARIGSKVNLQGKKDVRLYETEKLEDAIGVTAPIGLNVMIIGRFKYDAESDRYDSFEIEARHNNKEYKGWVSSIAIYAD